MDLIGRMRGMDLTGRMRGDDLTGRMRGDGSHWEDEGRWISLGG